jgi:hypothetical protein
MSNSPDNMTRSHNNQRGSTRPKPRPQRNQSRHGRGGFDNAMNNRNQMTPVFHTGASGQLDPRPRSAYLPQFPQVPYNLQPTPLPHQSYLPQLEQFPRDGYQVQYTPHTPYPPHFYLPLAPQISQPAVQIHQTQSVNLPQFPSEPAGQLPSSTTLVLAPPQQLNHTSSRTWKSKDKQNEEEYQRIRKQVRHIAPEMFKDRGEPFGESCEIFPRSVAQWKAFKYDIYGLRADELGDNAQKISDMADALKKVPKEKRLIKSAFGEGSQALKDGRGLLLSQPTIWSLAHETSVGSQQAPWPTQAELLWYGDSRGYYFDGSRADRSLPRPRQPAIPGISFHDMPLVQQSAMDRPGPFFEGGPHSVEIQDANAEMNDDVSVEWEGRVLLGAGLMEDTGEWQYPYVPVWRPAQDAGDISTQMAQMSLNSTPDASQGRVALTPQDHMH